MVDVFEAPLYGDVLQEVISRVPSLDLVPASHVSTTWRCAVSYSLRRSSRRRIPWLIFHVQRSRGYLTFSSPIITYAYDPHSRTWTQIARAVPLTAYGLGSSHPGLIHARSPSGLAVSSDAFGVTWRHLRPPRVSREDAVVALVGSRVVVAGGAYDFEGDPCAVESCAADGGDWQTCEPMPESFGDSASAMLLSVAASGTELHVLEKRSGLLCSFDPEANRWGRPCRLRQDPAVFLSAIGISGGGERLILVEAAGEATNVESLTLYELNTATMERREIGRMPSDLVERLVGDRWGLSSSIGFSMEGDFGYLYNPSDLREVFLCELHDGGCRWSSIGIPEAADLDPPQLAVFGCSTVKMDDLKAVIRPPMIG